MVNEQNLRPVRTEEEAREKGRRGGIASGEARRRKRTMKAAAKLIMDMGVTSEKNIQLMTAFGIEEEDLTNQMAVMVAMVNQAMKGNVRAATFLRDTLGESPEMQMHKEEMKLRREEFEYKKAKDAGETEEVEDLDAVEADIYGGDK